MSGPAVSRGADQLSERDRPLLSAAMIVRDEERHLEACLASLQDVVDEIVMVDTGSIDRSVDIAEAFGARVLHHPWRGDFAAARNVALDHAAGRWILYIDADERLRPTSRQQVVDLLDHAEEVAFRLLLRPFPRSTPYLEFRLWRNDPRIRFHGVIHEKVVDAIDAVASADGREIGDCTLALDHVGYDGDQTAKHHRNLALLQAQLQVEDDNVFNWRHLSRVLAGLGRLDEAEAALIRAVEVAQADPGAADAGLAWVDLIRLRHAMGDDVTALLAEGGEKWPENWLLVWTEGQVRLDQGQYREACESFNRLLAVDVANLPGSGMAFDERIFGSFAQASLGLCQFRLGRFEEAAEAYRAAEQLEPSMAEYRTKRILCQSLASRASGRDVNGAQRDVLH